MPIHKTLLGQIVNVARTKVKRAVGLTRSPRTRSATPTPSVRTAGETCADPGGGEPPPSPTTPTSPVCDSAYSDQHGCWPCDHRHSEGEASQPSSGRCSPRWDEEEDERTHHILTQGLGQDRPNPTSQIHSFDRNLRLLAYLDTIPSCQVSNAAQIARAGPVKCCYM